ncbi:MucBP domain-containing protein, partial [Carnobacterium maltaromaticum]|uniref:MucBP domain-containing protein n=1 Tax=Carnobacterium maltaromaticum TaxID=2751 RepID=UPI00026C892C
ANEKSIKDWLLKIKPENEIGVFTDQPQIVTYIYEKVEGAPVKVNYQDKEGNELAPTEILTGKIGTPYSVKEKPIKDWLLKIEPENAKGTFTDQPQTVTYVYEKVEGAPITVKYQDEEGNELETSEILTGRVGTAYNTNKKNIKGWTLKSEPKNATGAFTEEPQTVAYIYEKEKLSTNEILPSPTNKPNVNNPLFIHSITEHSGIFPKTGEEKNYSLIIGILIFISFIVTVDKKKYLGNKD